MFACKVFFILRNLQASVFGMRLNPKNHKNIRFPSNSGPDPLKITKLPSQHSILGYR